MILISDNRRIRRQHGTGNPQKIDRNRTDGIGAAQPEGLRCGTEFPPQYRSDQKQRIPHGGAVRAKLFQASFQCFGKRCRKPGKAQIDGV